MDCGEAVLLAQVAADLHRERAAVLVAEPAAHGANIDAGLDAARDKEMPGIVVRAMGIVETAEGCDQAAFRVVGRNNEIREGRLVLIR